MADDRVDSIRLKALVDKGNNRVIFAESDEGFIDVLFSFLTMPMGTIVRLTRDQPPAVDTGCMNNLYESVEKFDTQNLLTEACRTMLLCPRSGAETHCRSLKLQIDDTEPTRYFLCTSPECTISKYKLLSHHKGALCCCGETMSREINLCTGVSKNSISSIQDRGVFVKGLTRLLVRDDLQVMPLSSATSFSLLSKLGVIDGSTVEERNFEIGRDWVLALLKFSLVSKAPLTDTLLNYHGDIPLSMEDYNQGNSIQSQMEPEESNGGDTTIVVTIMVSKSRNVVCYAEAGEDFVDLLFSFLTLPLGYILEKMGGSSRKGCVDQLYTSVQDLDGKHYIKSDKHTEMLVHPMVAPGYRYENQPLGIVEASQPLYYYAHGYGRVDDALTTYEEFDAWGDRGTVLTVMDPKSPLEKTTNGGGYVGGPAMFTVTDNLIITPISPVSGISVLNQLGVPFNDIDERIVHVGNNKALRLLVASFLSESALTNAFIRKEPKQE